MIPLPELQNNTGRFIVVASSSCAERPASAALIGQLGVSSTAPRRSGILWRREKAQLGRQRAPSRAGRADDVIQYGRSDAATGGTGT